MVTWFDQLCGHPQSSHAHETKITIENFILGQNEISVCCAVHIDKI